MILALVASIFFSLGVGILAARNKRAESVLIPMLDVFQSIPILGFFPFVLLGIIAVIPGQVGITLAVVVLIFTSMSWNITFGVYEAVKSIPQEYLELSEMSGSSTLHKVTTLYIPASLSRVAYNTQISWAVGLFYLSASEILSLGNKSAQVAHGIAVDMFMFASQGDYVAYTYSFVLLIIAIIIWQFVFLREFAVWADRYKFLAEPHQSKRDPLMKFYAWVDDRSISKLFLLTHGRGVTSFTSSIARFRRGLKYALLALIVIFAALALPAIGKTAAQDFHSIPPFSRLSSDEAYVALSLLVSFARIWYLYFVCVVVAVPIAILVALNDKAYNFLSPVIFLIASVPAPLLLPVIYVLVAGQGEALAAVIIFLGMIWYILFNVVAGVRSIPSEVMELRRLFHLSTWQAWRSIYLPASATAFVTGSITAIGAAWNTLIVAEIFQSGTQFSEVGLGIGKVIVLAEAQRCPDVFNQASSACVANTTDWGLLILAILSMTALVIAFNLVVWRRAYHYVTKRYAYNA
ncbi:MAG TPA: ABC transporter permease subunit [Nitrososphaerales archaeon]|nr:ABC transporter permease subunit [Nitrososphaerales archaeon]